MNKVLRAYSVNTISRDNDLIQLCICSDSGNKTKLISIIDSKTFQKNNVGTELIEVFGRVPSNKAEAFKQYCLNVNGVPTTEISNNHEYCPIKLKSILDYCDNSLSSLKEGDILIIEEYDLDSLIEITLNRASNEQKNE